MLENYNSDYEEPDYRIPENRYNSESNIEFDSKIEYVDFALSDLRQEIEDDEVQQARALVQESYVEKPLPKPEINIPYAVKRMYDQGNKLEQARAYYLDQKNSQRNLFHKILFLPESIDEARDKIEIPIASKVFQVPGFSFFYYKDGHWFGKYDYSDSYGQKSIVLHYEIVFNDKSEPIGVLKCSSEIDVPNAFVGGEEMGRLADSVEAIVAQSLIEYGHSGNIAQKVDSQDLDMYSASKIA